MTEANVRPASPLRRVARLLPHPSTTPFTFWYLVILLATTAVLHLVPSPLAHRILSFSSTDPHNLWQRPVFSLITSALWLVDARWLIYAVIFTAILAPLERRIGWRWTLAVFLSGHILATLATEIPVTLAKHAQLLTAAETSWLDIGVSYGFFASLGVLLMIMTRPARTIWIIIVELFIVLVYLVGEPTELVDVVTFVGHLVALHLGMFAWLPWLRRRHLAGSWHPQWFKSGNSTSNSPVDTPNKTETRRRVPHLR